MSVFLMWQEHNLSFCVFLHVGWGGFLIFTKKEWVGECPPTKRMKTMDYAYDGMLLSNKKE